MDDNRERLLLQNFDLFLALAGDNHEMRTELISYYAVVKSKQFQQSGRIEDLNEAISKARLAVGATAEDSEHFGGRLSNLSNMLSSRYDRQGQVEDLEEAIRLARLSVQIIQVGNPQRALCLNNLGLRLASRYQDIGSVGDLEEAIKATEESIEAMPGNDSDKTEALSNLAFQLELRYKRNRNTEDIERAIALARRSVNATPHGVPELARRQNNLGNMYESRYGSAGMVLEDLEEAIRMARQSVEATPTSHTEKSSRLFSLGNKLARRYKHLGQLEDLEEAIQLNQRSIELVPPNHPECPSFLDGLAAKLETRYECQGHIEDLEEAIRMARRAVEGTPNNHANLAAYLNNLGAKLALRHDIDGNIDDLEQAVDLTRQSLQRTPVDHQNRAALQKSLGNKLSRLYERRGRVTDLDEAIKMARESVETSPDDHSDLVFRMVNLSNKLESRYELTWEIDDLEEAIEMLQRAKTLLQPDYVDVTGLLNNLANKLERRYEYTGKMEDLEEAIALTRESVKITPNDHPNLAGCLQDLANKLKSRYKRTGNMEDLKEAVHAAQMSVNATPERNTLERAGRLSNLATALLYRYERTRKMEDLKEGISLLRLSIDLIPDDHPSRGGTLTNLGIALSYQYERTRKLDDLDESIEMARRSIEATADGHSDLSTRLNNLGGSLTCRYERTDNMDDLQEVIKVIRRSIEATPDDHPQLTSLLNNLGNGLENLYKHTGQVGDLEEAIKVARRAVELTPEDHPDIAGCLNNLGAKLVLLKPPRYSEALDLFYRAWNCHSAIPFLRIRAANLAIPILQDQKQYERAYQLSVKAIDVLPRVHNRSLSRQDQQHVVSTFSGLATCACSLALQTGRCPEDAIDVLERGRAVILSLLLDDRSDISALKTAQPELCATYENLRSEVNTAIDGAASQRLREVALERRSKAVEELDRCIKDIRKLPLFARFQKGLAPEQVKQCAAEGCIIVVNVTDLRSDAVVISTNELRVVPLADLDVSQTRSWIDQDLTSWEDAPKSKAYFEFLSWLWKVCVKPVLEHLEYHPQSSIESLPRIWWIGTGLASSLPFHAACDGAARSAEAAYHRAISSYTPSIKALMHTREAMLSSPLESGETPKLLFVTMATTPFGDNPSEGALPGAKMEKSEVVAIARSCISVQTLDQPDVASVMRHLEQCSIAHFACHGVSNPYDPSESGLLLQTAGTPTAPPTIDKLTVRELSDANLSRARLAYLSACSTAENKEGQLIDEVLHVVSGFQVAGFRHVVGCLWPSNDLVCVKMAELFYSGLIEGGQIKQDDRAIAVALHKATVALRNDAAFRKVPLYWAPYVHFGA